MKWILWVSSGMCVAGMCRGGQVRYGVGDWPRKLDLGSHRAVVRVEEPADAVWAHIPWRRRDGSPEEKAVIVVDAKTGERLDNVLPVTIRPEYGDVLFQPLTAPGDYYVYYLPHRTPRGCMDAQSYVYLGAGAAGDPEPEWLARNSLARAPKLSASGRVGWLGWYEAGARPAAMPDALVKTDADTVLRVAIPGGAVSTFASGTGTGRGGCAWGPDGHLYVSDGATKDVRGVRPHNVGSSV